MPPEGSPLLCNIKQNSLDDGPGIRTVFFFKGCPLRCAWCQNPEAQDTRQELVFQADKCIHCNPCTVVCPSGAFIYDNAPSLNREECRLHFNCVHSCPADVFKKAGSYHDVENLVDLAKENKVFFKNSGGGITLTGGEPLLFPRYVQTLVESLKREDINIVLETCGMVRFTSEILSILEQVDLIYYDVKIIDPTKHEQHVGGGNSLILQNLEHLVKNSLVILPDDKNMVNFKENAYEKPLLIPRIPLIPGLTTGRENLLAIKAFLTGIGFKVIDLLLYNPLWLEKAKTLKMEIKYNRDTWMKKEELEEIREIFGGFQFESFK
ncbi:MAG: glycyl-radical enzyme activating protein [Candidatus Hodarchaeota archaeon]